MSFLKLFLVVKLAWRRSLLLIIHNLLSKGLARLHQELTLAALDIIFPLWLLEVLGPGYVIHDLCLEVSEILPFLSVARMADRDGVLVVRFG